MKVDEFLDFQPALWLSSAQQEVLADAARVKKGGGGRVRLSDVDTWELAGV